MRFSESWKMAASASFRMSSAASDCSAGARDGSVGSVDQPAQQRFVTNDLDVVLDARSVGDAIEQG